MAPTLQVGRAPSSAQPSSSSSSPSSSSSSESCAGSDAGSGLTPKNLARLHRSSTHAAASGSSAPRTTTPAAHSSSTRVHLAVRAPSSSLALS